MAAVSTGILMWRRGEIGPEVLLAHFGGPLWRHRDEGAWSMPKGLLGPGEDPEVGARREFAEELGSPAVGPLIPLGEIRQKGGKKVIAFALEGDLDSEAITSNMFELEWPPRSGFRESFPEVDRAAWMGLDQARKMILPSQAPLIDRLQGLIASPPCPD